MVYRPSRAARQPGLREASPAGSAGAGAAGVSDDRRERARARPGHLAAPRLARAVRGAGAGPAEAAGICLTGVSGRHLLSDLYGPSFLWPWEHQPHRRRSQVALSSAECSAAMRDRHVASQRQAEAPGASCSPCLIGQPLRPRIRDRSVRPDGIRSAELASPAAQVKAAVTGSRGAQQPYGPVQYSPRRSGNEAVAGLADDNAARTEPGGTRRWPRAAGPLRRRLRRGRSVGSLISHASSHSSASPAGRPRRPIRLALEQRVGRGPPPPQAGRQRTRQYALTPKSMSVGCRSATTAAAVSPTASAPERCALSGIARTVDSCLAGQHGPISDDVILQLYKTTFRVSS